MCPTDFTICIYVDLLNINCDPFHLNTSMHLEDINVKIIYSQAYTDSQTDAHGQSGCLMPMRHIRGGSLIEALRSLTIKIIIKM